MRGVIQTCKSQNVNPATSKGCDDKFFSKTSINSASLSGMSNKYNLAILDTHMKSTENINSIDVPTNFYQKTQHPTTVYNIFENLKKIIGFFSATKFEIETVFALFGSLC